MYHIQIVNNNVYSVNNTGESSTRCVLSSTVYHFLSRVVDVLLFLSVYFNFKYGIKTCLYRIYSLLDMVQTTNGLGTVEKVVFPVYSFLRISYCALHTVDIFF